MTQPEGQDRRLAGRQTVLWPQSLFKRFCAVARSGPTNGAPRPYLAVDSELRGRAPRCPPMAQPSLRFPASGSPLVVRFARRTRSMLETGRETTRSTRSARRAPYPSPAGVYDEMVADDGRVRPQYRRIHELWSRLTPAEFGERRRAVDRAFLRQGITFNVYGDAAGRRADLPVRPDAAASSRPRVAQDRGRPRAAHHRAQPVPARRLPRAEDREGRRRAGRTSCSRPGTSGASSWASRCRATSTSTSAAPT